MKTIMMWSLKGGTGRTTVCANLGGLLHHQGRHCFLVDTDPQNMLALHLGMQVGERYGLALPEVTEHELAAYKRRNPSPIPHLPFGSCGVDELLTIARRADEAPDLLLERLSVLAPPRTEAVIVDAPPLVSPWTHSLVRRSDFVLLVLAPDAACYATLPALQEMVALREDQSTVAFVVNKMDPRVEFNRDVRAAMEQLLGDRLLPFSIPIDSAFPEALGRQLLLREHSPNSLALNRLRELAQWVVEHVLDT